ncbi:MAG: type B 50S ribosomal protein L31 [Chlamydiales bacterium]|nr:type B 50S ribosomal protein L31 [Chlamydiales bacterium]
MKDNTHPPYQEVLFVDSSTGTQFLIGSTLQTKEKGVFEGKEYPLYRVPVSSASHPFFTKANQFIDSEGRVDKFTKKYQRKSEQVKQAQEKQEEGKKEVLKSAKKKK